MRAAVPGRVTEKLAQLATGLVTRQEVSLWACEWAAAPVTDVPDDVVRTALILLGSADVRAGPHDYLYFEPNFRAWLAEIEDAAPC